MQQIRHHMYIGLDMEVDIRHCLPSNMTTAGLVVCYTTTHNFLNICFIIRVCLILLFFFYYSFPYDK